MVPDEFIKTPPKDHLIQALYVKHVEIRGRWVQGPMRYDKVEGGNLILDYLISAKGPQVVDTLMTVTFKDLRQRREYDFEDKAEEILKRGILFSGTVYRFLGHSNSQLKDRTCYLMNVTDEEIYDLLAQFGDFSNIGTAAKRAKRIGLLFSSFTRSINLEEHEYRVIDDVERNNYIFTDGCGLMSEQFAKEIQDVQKLEATPSVVQIRYQGFKGVILLHRELDHGQQVKVQFRKSMRKFLIPDERMRKTCTTFGVVQCSQPYTIGYLNKQIIMLLVDCGVDHAFLTKLQSDFHSMLKGLGHSRQVTEQYLGIKGEIKLLERLDNYGLESHRLQKDLRGLRAKEVKKMQKDNVADETDNVDAASASSKCKLRVLVPRSRIVFAVCDPLNELEYGQCIFQPTMFDEIQFAEFEAANEVMVVRNPCYHVGDIRVLKLVKNKAQYAHLSDCIIFPTKGRRPHADESSGGDLDGDVFFVSWDSDLIPQWRSSPFDYSTSSPLVAIPNAIKKYWEQLTKPLTKRIADWGHESMPFLFGTQQQAEKERKQTERRHMLEYFTSYNNYLVGRVDSIFMKYAALYGPSCSECVYLNRFFSDAVDMVASKMLIEAELRNLEREYHRKVAQLPSHHHPQSSGWLSFLIGKQKPPFRPGDDLWTRMEERTKIFVDEMSMRS